MPEGTRFQLEKYKARRGGASLCVGGCRWGWAPAYGTKSVSSAGGCPAVRYTDRQPFCLHSPQHLADQKLVQKKHQIEMVDQLKPIADELGCTLAQVSARACCTSRLLLRSNTASLRWQEVTRSWERCQSAVGASAPTTPSARALRHHAPSARLLI